MCVTDACTYCGQDVTAHDPVFVTEPADGGREQMGPFCNYACLSARIEVEDSTTGACCRVDPTA